MTVLPWVGWHIDADNRGVDIDTAEIANTSHSHRQRGVSDPLVAAGEIAHSVKVGVAYATIALTDAADPSPDRIGRQRTPTGNRTQKCKSARHFGSLEDFGTRAITRRSSPQSRNAEGGTLRAAPCSPSCSPSERPDTSAGRTYGRGSPVLSSRMVICQPARPRSGRKSVSIVRRCASAACAAAPTHKSFLP